MHSSILRVITDEWLWCANCMLIVVSNDFWVLLCGAWYNGGAFCGQYIIDTHCILFLLLVIHIQSLFCLCIHCGDGDGRVLLQWPFSDEFSLFLVQVEELANYCRRRLNQFGKADTFTQFHCTSLNMLPHESIYFECIQTSDTNKLWIGWQMFWPITLAKLITDK